MFGHEKEFTLTPEGGIVRNGNDSAIAYGASIAVYDPPSGGRSDTSLESATAQLMEGFQRSNPSMRRIREFSRVRVAGKSALSGLYENKSPLGGREIDWVVTVMRPEGLTAFIFVSPEPDYDAYRRVFEKILNSVDFINR